MSSEVAMPVVTIANEGVTRAGAGSLRATRQLAYTEYIMLTRSPGPCVVYNDKKLLHSLLLIISHYVTRS